MCANAAPTGPNAGQCQAKVEAYRPMAQTRTAMLDPSITMTGDLAE
jgi:hypothetical protein